MGKARVFQRDIFVSCTMMALQPTVNSQESEDTDTDFLDSGTKTQLNRPPGLTGPISNSNDPPALFHKVKNQKSILALVVSDSKIYAGTQGGEILVSFAWPRNSKVLLIRSEILDMVTRNVRATLEYRGTSR